MNDKDIKILENYIYNKKDTMKEQLVQAIENLLKENKELSEENAILKRANNISEDVKIEDITKFINKSIEDFNKEYIPVAKIKEKKEELEKEYNEILADYGNIDADVIINIPNENVRKYLEKLADKIITLQELLEGI